MHEVSVRSVKASCLKKKRNIQQTNLAKYLSAKDTMSLDEIVQAAKFREMMKFIAPQFEPKFINNTDQTACQY